MRLSDVTPSDIASALGLKLEEAWAFARTVERHFQAPRLQNIGKKGKKRLIDAPYGGGIGKKRLRKLHRWLKSLRFEHPRAYGSVSGKSCFKSAHQHLGQSFVWKRDAQDCYPSVTSEAFKCELRKLGLRQDTATMLTLLCVVRDRLPQGSPLSGDALNLFFWLVDQQIASGAGQRKLMYSRTADDFVVSGGSLDNGDALMSVVESELGARGIHINQKKKLESGLQRTSEIQLVHNIAVNRRKGSSICTEHRTKAIEIARQYLEGCRSVTPSSLVNLAAKHDTLRGHMHYQRQAMFNQAAHLRKQLEAGERVVLRKLNQLGLQAYKNKWWVRVQLGKKIKLDEPRRLAAAWLAILKSSASK